VEGRELDCCKTSSGREGRSEGASTGRVHVMVDDFSGAIGEMPPEGGRIVGFPWVAELIQTWGGM
jgi:hypothetical protein